MSVTTIPLLRDLQGPWAGLQIEMIGLGPVQLPDVYPFLTVNDLKRLLWIHRRGEPRWAPDRVFLGVRSAAGIRPLDFHWPATVTGIDLPDPLSGPQINPALVDEMGQRRPVVPTMIGSLILETALSPELTLNPTLPLLVAIPLTVLAPSEAQELTGPLYNGFIQLYFPWLTAPAQVLDAASPTRELGEAYAAAVPYMEDRIGRIGVVQRALIKGVAGEAATMNTMVRLRWTLPPPSAKPESLERVFYSLHASTVIPFMRFFPAGGRSAPLMKLGLKPDGSPIIDNEKVLTQYLNQVAPTMKSAVILARIPLTSAHGSMAFTLYMFEDGTSDITLEVPQRGATYIAAIAVDAQRVLRDVVVAIGYAPDTVPQLRDIHASYRWTHPDPRRASPISANRLQTRVAALTPFLDVIPAVKDDTALATFQWRAVSNYEGESAQFAYITQLVLRKGGATLEEEGMATYAADVAERFGITPAAAAAVIEQWMERRAAAVAPAVGSRAGSLAVPRHSTGASIAITEHYPEYTLEVQDVDSYTELQRILSVVGVLLGSSSSDLSILPPAPVIQAVAAAVAVADATTVEAAGGGSSAAAAAPDEGDVELGEMDPAMAALLGDLGFGEDAFDVGEPAATANAGPDIGPGLIISEMEAAVAAPESAIAIAAATAVAPNLDAAMAAVEEECQRKPWAAGDKPRAIDFDYYMTKLKRLDKIMFGFSSSVTGRAKSYSKSCQRSDGRQPNSMTLAEYARIKRCYENRVRFVDLPPRKPSDLPQDPAYNPKKRRTDEYFLTDPTPGVTQGWPMWIVYGYSNKTSPGEYIYLMCAELWCERDNLPLLRSEFMANGNRCPFCDGTVFANMAKPQYGESVVLREPKESTGKLHQFAGVITRNKHPDGYSLPCCDTTPRLLEKYLKAAFSGQAIYGRDLAGEEEGEEGEGASLAAAGAAAAAEPPEPGPELGLNVGLGEGTPIEYRKILGSMQTQYILGNDKTLEAGKIGLVPPILDAFFGQNSIKSLESRGIRPTFAEGVHLFVRVGVDTRIRTQGLNLFAGLAPLLGFDSAEECQRHIMTREMVRGFESANYGSLVQEFAATSTVSAAELAASLPTFAGAPKTAYRLDTNRAHVVRLYKAWISFLKYLSDVRTPKQLRHLEHLLAQPGTITPRGLLIITLEQKGDRIEVVCPSFGIPMASLFGDVPVAFLWHDRRDESWEPIVLYNGTKDAVRFFGERSPELEVLPPPLRQSLNQWLRDWRSSSRGCGRPAPPPHVWTPDRDTSGLPRLTQLRNRMEGAVATTQVRDRSNRLAGVLFTVTGVSTPLFVPCLDDGTLAEAMPRIFEADSIPPAPLDAYLRFYSGLAAQFPGLRPIEALFRGDPESHENQIIGFRTTVGSIVPTAPTPMGKGIAAGIPEEPVDEIPWERDSLILKNPEAAGSLGSILEESTASVEEQLAEAYQHVRLTLSRWLIRDTRGPAMRAELSALINSRLPLYEKRKRMDITLGPLIYNWIYVEHTDVRKPLPILRQDCLSLGAEACALEGACRWTSGGSATASATGSRCLIHAPSRGDESTVIRIFTARLSDELLRYSSARHDIFDNHVASIRTPRGAVRVGDELFMATKLKEGAASILNRLGFTGQSAISFPEEMLRFEGAEEEEDPAVSAAATTAAATAAVSLPPAWTAAGFQIASPPPGLEQAGALAFAEGTGRSLETWETYIKDRRKKLGLPGDPERPLQWSIQDFYVIAALKLSNIIFAHTGPMNSVVIDRWIRPPSSGTAKITNPMFIIFWGPQQLLTTKGKIYMFTSKDLPSEFMSAMETAVPMSEADVRGYTAAEAGTAGTANPVVIDLPEAQAPRASEFNFPAATAKAGTAGTANPVVIDLPEAAATVAASEFNFPAATAKAGTAKAGPVVIDLPAAAAPRASEFNFPEAAGTAKAGPVVIDLPEAPAPRASEFNFPEAAGTAKAGTAKANPVVIDLPKTAVAAQVKPPPQSAPAVAVQVEPPLEAGVIESKGDN